MEDVDEGLERRVLSRRVADEVAAAAAADEAREQAKTIAAERAKRASAEEAPLELESLLSAPQANPTCALQ